VGLIHIIRGYVDALVHPSVTHDALTAARHRAFIAPRLVGSAVAIAAIPVYLAMRGVPNALEMLVFCWLVAPILSAYYLSRTGRYEGAHLLSSLALTGLIVIVASKTGGIASFAAIWLVVVPLEAALSASRRVVATASLLALGAAALLLLSSIAHLLPHPVTQEQNQGAILALGVISASLYATGLALGAESLARTSFWLFYAEEDRYRLLARNMTDAITRHGPGGAVLFASPAAEPLFGARADELLGHGLFDRVHVADRPAYLTALSDALASGEPQSVEFRVRRDLPSGHGAENVHFIWIEMRCRPLEVAATRGDRPAREVVAVMRDVTERKAQEHALEDAHADAARANVAKSRFLAIVSHELRTPLNAIIGFSEMLINERDMQLDAARRADYARLINESGTHLLSVVNGILDQSRLDNGEFEIQPEPFAPAPVIDGCCELLKLKAVNAGVDIFLDLPGGLPEILADKRALKQIVINLLSNAIKFTNRGGRIVVSAAVEDSDLVIVVEDNGIGIRAEDLRRVGDPFFQAGNNYDRRHAGTGLGLSIVKGLVALHCGNVDTQSSPATGTRVTVRLPLDCEKARAIRDAGRCEKLVHVLPSGAAAAAAGWGDNHAVKISA
jgi:cell cycle sensor histidine kinase DivJ